jgi:hypothetical protein
MSRPIDDARLAEIEVRLHEGMGTVRDTDALIAEVRRLRARLDLLAAWAIEHGKHARGCQRSRCARPFCDSCVCSCGFDDVARAALAGSEAP